MLFSVRCCALRGVLTCSAGMLLAVTVSSQTINKYNVNFTESPPTIDGIVSPGEWDDAAAEQGGWHLLRDTSRVDNQNSRWRAVWDDSRTPLAELGDDWASDFHVWRMDWDENRIALSVDGRELNTVDLAETVNETPGGDNPFHQPHYMILNLAIGGTNGGDPGDTEFPARFEVDYVRVYQTN